MGGGIILKPLIDFTGIYGISTTNLLSGSVVFAMSLSNAMTKKMLDPYRPVFVKEMKVIAVGSLAGGVVGNKIFWLMVSAWGERQSSIFQTTVLLVMNVWILYFTLKGLSKVYHVNKTLSVFALGLGIGTLASFLGIGGGPINIILLQLVMGFSLKEAVDYSLCMILFTQGANIILSVAAGKMGIDIFEQSLVYIFAGIAGGIFGRMISNRISEEKVQKVYVALIVLIIGIVGLTMVRYFL